MKNFSLAHGTRSAVTVNLNESSKLEDSLHKAGETLIKAAKQWEIKVNKMDATQKKAASSAVKSIEKTMEKVMNSLDWG